MKFTKPIKAYCLFLMVADYIGGDTEKYRKLILADLDEDDEPITPKNLKFTKKDKYE